MKKILLLGLPLLLLGVGCATKNAPEAGMPSGGRPIVQDVEKPNGECPWLRTKNDGPLIYSAEDASAQFGRTWDFKWLDSSENSCTYELSAGTYGKPDFKTIFFSKNALFSAQILEAIMEGKPYNQGFSVQVVPGIGNAAYFVGSPSDPTHPTLYFDKNDNLATVECKTCSNEELIQMGKVAVQRMR